MSDSQIYNASSSTDIQTMEDLFKFLDSFDASSRNLVNDNNEILFDPSEWHVKDSTGRRLRPPNLHEFLCLLVNNSRYDSYASWLDKDEGLFKMHQPDQVAKLWQKVKLRQTKTEMNYDKLSRAIRNYYLKGIMIPTGLAYTYRFGTIGT